MCLRDLPPSQSGKHTRATVDPLNRQQDGVQVPVGARVLQVPPTPQSSPP